MLAGKSETRVLRFGVFELDLENRELRRNGIRIPLQPLPFKVLTLLASHPNHLLTRDEIQHEVWCGEQFGDFDDRLNFCIKKIREVLDDHAEAPRYIKTLRKGGYTFIAPVECLNGRALPGTPAQPAMIGDHGPNSAENKCQDVAGRATDPSPGSPATAGSPPSPQGRGLKNVKTPGAGLKAGATGGMPGPSAGNQGQVGHATADAGLKPGATVEKARRAYLVAGLSVGLALAWVVVSWLRVPNAGPRATNPEQLTHDGRGKGGALCTDGSRLYFTEAVGGRWAVVQMPVKGGEPVIIPSTIPDNVLTDLSPDGSELLVLSQSGTDVEARLWVLPVTGGSARRVGSVVASEARWSPGGKEIVYASGHSLYLVNSDGTAPRKVLTAAGVPVALRWSPDATRLRFTVGDPKTGSSSVWEAAADGGSPHPLFPGSSNPPEQAGEGWTPDGKFFLVAAKPSERRELWVVGEKVALFGKAERGPVRLDLGASDAWNVLPSKDGKKLFAMMRGPAGGELVRYDSKTQQFVSYFAGLSATFLSFSPNEKQVTYVGYPQPTLWRARADGSYRQQLTFPPLEVMLPRWSPDSKRIAFTAREPGGCWKVHIIPAEGGTPQQLIVGDLSGGGEGAPTWSPDGQSIMFGEVAREPAGTCAIHRVDLRRRVVSNLRCSEGLRTARWSPDGRYAAALRPSRHELVLFDFATQRWTTLAHGVNGDNVSWSRDGKYVYADSPFGNDPMLLRVRICDRKVEPAASLKDLELLPGALGAWFGLDPTDAPILFHDATVPEVFAFDWEAP